MSPETVAAQEHAYSVLHQAVDLSRRCRRCDHSLFPEDVRCPSCGLTVDYGAII